MTELCLNIKIATTDLILQKSGCFKYWLFIYEYKC